MECRLYKCTADYRKLDKSSSISMIKTVKCTLKENTSILNPVLKVSKISVGNIKKLNYLYIPDFARYYFITDIIECTGNILELHCKVDVLFSYKDDIKGITTLILRQENINNPYIEDAQLLVRSNRTYEKINVGKVGDSSNHYYLTVNNGGV